MQYAMRNGHWLLAEQYNILIWILNFSTLYMVYMVSQLFYTFEETKKRKKKSTSFF